MMLTVMTNEPGSSKFSVMENDEAAIGTTLATVATTDADVGIDGQVVLSLVSVTPASVSLGAFSLVDAGGSGGSTQVRLLAMRITAIDADATNNGLVRFDLLTVRSTFALGGANGEVALLDRLEYRTRRVRARITCWCR